MKLCPICKDSILKNSHIVQTDDNNLELFIYSYYRCVKSHGICIGRYAYCRLCLEILKVKDMPYHESRKHNHYIHRGVIEPYSNRNFDFSKINTNIKISRTHIAYMTLSYNTHLSLLNFDNIIPSDELINILNSPPFASDILDLCDLLMEAFILNNNYSCTFCGEYYETFPSGKMVYNHLKTCSVMVGMREANKEIQI